eukprot:jgi/Galph1/2714/GphlegSOOS_G1408.1
MSISTKTGRRTWDKAFFEKKAKERQILSAEKAEENETERAKLAKLPDQNDQFAPTRSWLERRDYQLDFEKRVGKATVVSSLKDKNSGFYCEVCKVLQKDSNAYLNHLNSRLHQKQLGMAMRVERVNAEAVKNRIEKLTKQKKGEENTVADKNTTERREETESASLQTEKKANESQVEEREEEQQNKTPEEESEASYENMAKVMGLPVSFASSR